MQGDIFGAAIIITPRQNLMVRAGRKAHEFKVIGFFGFLIGIKHHLHIWHICNIGIARPCANKRVIAAFNIAHRPNPRAMINRHTHIALFHARAHFID